MKKTVSLSLVLVLPYFSSIANADSNVLGLLGGRDQTGTLPPLGAFVSASGQVTNLNLSSLTNSGEIESVAINASGTGLLGGRDLVGTQPPLGAFVSASGQVTNLNLSSLTTIGFISGVAINNSGTGLLGGTDFNTTEPLGALVSSSGQVTNLNLSSLTTFGTIYSVAINNSGTGLIGGQDFNTNEPLGALVSSSGQVTNLNLSSLTTNGDIKSVAINDSGTSLLGGRDFNGSSPPLGILVSPSGQLTNLNLSSLTTSALIESVAINNFGAGLLGGREQTGDQPPFAALVSSSGQLTNLNLSSLTTNGFITSVAINDSGTGLIGGLDFTGTEPPLGILVSSAGQVTNLNLSSLTTHGSIESVAINNFGAGLLGGRDLNTLEPLLAMVSSSGQVTKLNLSSFTNSGNILSVAIVKLLSNIPTEGLSGNNLIFANYINENSPNNAFYFVPAVLDGTLSKALESAAPTRNAFSVFAADNNLFFFNQSLSRHSRDSRQFKRFACLQNNNLDNRKKCRGLTPDSNEEKNRTSANVASAEWKEGLLANNSEKIIAKGKKPEAGPLALWGEIFGAFAYQKAQDQTPAFNPTSGGVILALDGEVNAETEFGGGAAYAYTHIHEKEKAGHANINQEYLFLYALWSNYNFYTDIALWGGLFQSRSVRDIHMTGFDFTSKAHLNGWQLAPHFETGYDFSFWKQLLLVEPFVMFDWISNWQRSYKETGSGPFNAGQKKQYSSFLRSELGFRFYETISFDVWRLVLQEKIGYVNKKPFKLGTVTAFLIGAPGTFTVETFTSPQNLASAEMQLIFEPVNPRYPYGTISYQGEFCPKYQSHEASINISWNF